MNNFHKRCCVPRLLIAFVLMGCVSTQSVQSAPEDPSIQVFVSREFVSSLAARETSRTLQLNNIRAQGWTASGSLTPSFSVVVSKVESSPWAVTVDFQGTAVLDNGIMRRGRRRVTLFARFQVSGHLRFEIGNDSVVLRETSVRVRPLCIIARRRSSYGLNVSRMAQRRMDVNEVERKTALAIVQMGNTRLNQLELNVGQFLIGIQGQTLTTEVTNGNVFARLSSGRANADFETFKGKLVDTMGPRVAIRIHQDQASRFVEQSINAASSESAGKNWKFIKPLQDKLQRVDCEFRSATDNDDGTTELKIECKLFGDKNEILGGVEVSELKSRKEDGKWYGNVRYIDGTIRFAEDRYLFDDEKPLLPQLRDSLNHYTRTKTNRQQSVMDRIQLRRADIDIDGEKNDKWLTIELKLQVRE